MGSLGVPSIVLVRVVADRFGIGPIQEASAPESVACLCYRSGSSAIRVSFISIQRTLLQPSKLSAARTGAYPSVVSRSDLSGIRRGLALNQGRALRSVPSGRMVLICRIPLVNSKHG